MIDLKKRIQEIPNKPGCYLYKDKDDNIIYIGKAKDLKKRVNSYFVKNQSGIKTKILVNKIEKIEFIITKNEIEAFILESNLIKQHQPRYNILLKDSKKYPYIVITNEKYPRLMSTRKTNLNAKYFGPYPDGSIKNLIIETLTKKFKIRTCKTLPKNACLRYQINLCDAPCINNISKEEYDRRINDIENYLKGNNKGLLKDLNKKMNSYSKIQEYEKAMKVKEQIDAINYLEEKQIIDQTNEIDEDIINYLIVEDKITIIVFNVREGLLKGKNEYNLDFKEEFLDEFIKSYYTKENSKIPSTIYVPKELKDNGIENFLANIANRKISIKVPKRGIKKELLELAKKNIEVRFNFDFLAKKELKERLHLEDFPNVIECFDISHIQGSDMVASMAQFKDSKPNKSEYRKFKINTVVGVDDFRAMHEVVLRRYKRLLSENLKLPDLIVIDGGEIQLSFAKKALDELNINIPIIGLAKKFEEIYIPNKKLPIRFNKDSNMMKLLIQLRDETHRFGINYHRKVRNKRYFED